jgi:hypothetical protein
MKERKKMKVKMLIQEDVYDALNASFHEAWEADGGCYVGLVVDTNFLSYVTSGNNRWTLTKEGNELFLSYQGSRWGFLDGCNAVKVEKKNENVITVFDCFRNDLGMALLSSWESTVPGNPGPWDDWETILQESLELTKPESIGEWIERKVSGWKEMLPKLKSSSSSSVVYF